jgi:hypothetical protein
MPCALTIFTMASRHARIPTERLIKKKARELFETSGTSSGFQGEEANPDSLLEIYGKD